MKILLLGSNGQLGREILKNFNTNLSDFNIFAPSKNELNLVNFDQCRDTILDIRPDWIINAAAFTHTSIAIRDALSIFKKPVIELHISNIYKREEFRHKSLISNVATGVICGFGSEGYVMSLNAMNNLIKNENR